MKVPYWKMLTFLVILIGLVVGFIQHYKGVKWVIWAIIPACFCFAYCGLAVLRWFLDWRKNPNKW